MVKHTPRSASILTVRLDRFDQRKVNQRIVIIIDVIKWVSVLDGWRATRHITETEEKDKIKNSVFHAALQNDLSSPEISTHSNFTITLFSTPAWSGHRRRAYPVRSSGGIFQLRPADSRRSRFRWR